MKPSTSRFEELLQLREEFNSLLRLLTETGVIDRRDIVPHFMELPVDIIDKDGELNIFVEIPGVSPGNLSVSVLRDVVIVEGRRDNTYPEAVKFHCMERDFGEFSRLIELPRPVDTRSLKATYSGGVLTLVAPRISERRGRRAPIEVEFLDAE